MVRLLVLIRGVEIFVSYLSTTCAVQLAFSVMTYQRPNQLWNDTFHEFQRLMNVIYNPDKHFYVLHTDIKSNSSLINCISNEYCKPKSNCKSIKSRNIAWGGLSTGEMMLALMQEAYDHKDVTWDYFILLDHQSLPLVSLNFLEKCLGSFPKETNFIHCWNIKDYDFFGQFESNSWRLQETVIDNFAGKLLETSSVKRAPPDDIEFYKSLQHTVLSRSFIKYALFGPDTRRILLYLVNVRTSDEMFLSTLMQHNPYFASTASCMTTLHFSHWVKPGGSWHPEYLTMEHLPLLLSQMGVSALFARKFHYIDSQELINVLDRIRKEVFTDYHYDPCISYGKDDTSLPLYSVQAIYNHQKGISYLPTKQFPPYKYPTYQNIVELRNKSFVSPTDSHPLPQGIKYSTCEKKNSASVLMNNHNNNNNKPTKPSSIYPPSLLTSQSRYRYTASMKWLLPIALKYVVKVYTQSVKFMNETNKTDIEIDETKKKEYENIRHIIENAGDDIMHFITTLNITGSESMTSKVAANNDDGDDVLLLSSPVNSNITVWGLLDLLDRIRLARESVATEEFLNYYAHIGFQKVYDSSVSSSDDDFSSNGIINYDLEINEIEKCVTASQVHPPSPDSDATTASKDNSCNNTSAASRLCKAKLADQSNNTCMNTSSSSDDASITTSKDMTIEIPSEKQKRERIAMERSQEFHKKHREKKSHHFARRPLADTYQEFLTKQMMSY